MQYIFLVCMTLMAQACWAKITIQDAYARASRGPNSAIFMTIQNDGETATLIGATVSQDICQYTELHTHIQEGDVFKMRKVENLQVPAKGQLLLKRGGDHIMLMQIPQPLEEGKTITLTLQFKGHPAMTVDVPVRKI
jgi:copper(I)-binding protein